MATLLQLYQRNRSRLRYIFVLALAVLVFLMLLLAAHNLQAQTPATSQPTAAPTSFEVASIRPAKDCTGPWAISPSGSRIYTMPKVSMAYLIGVAYGVGDDQIDKNPKWISEECYSVSARATGEGNLPNAQLKVLLQDMLAQRFHLAVHREVRDFSGYALVVAKGGPQLTPSKGVSATGSIWTYGVKARNISMTSFSSMLKSATGAHVADKTGLTDKYDIDLSFAPADSTDSTLPSIFTAIQEQLGLKLEPQKVPVSMVIIDHVDRFATEN
jgi:uncharacterized protein (TIGR03435 family)